MRLAYSTNAFVRYPLDEALSAIARLGYAAAEILCDRPHWFPGETLDTDAERTGELIGRLGLKISNLNVNTANGYFDPAPPENVFEPSLTNPDPRQRAWREQYTIDALRLAHLVGAPCISVTAGRPIPGCPPARALEHFVGSLRTVCAAADQYDVRVGIEYEPGLLVERATEVMDVLERVDSSRLGVNLDIGHSYLAREEPRQTIDLLADRIWNVHVEDIRGLKHFHLIPGEGDLPFPEYLDALDEVGYGGFLTVELYSYPDAPVAAGRRAAEYLTSLLQRWA